MNVGLVYSDCYNSEAASDTEAATNHHAIKAVVDVLAVGGEGRLRTAMTTAASRLFAA